MASETDTERARTDGCVIGAADVAAERKRTNRRITLSFDIVSEGLVSIRCVIGADAGAAERKITNRRVKTATGIETEGL